MQRNDLGNLFEPLEVGNLQLRNRLVMAAISTKYGSPCGGITDNYKDYYIARAKGGVGLIIIENTCVDYPKGKGSSTEIRIDNHKFIPGLNMLVEAVHEEGAKIAVQLHHAGRQTNLEITEGEELVSASECICSVTGGRARELTKSEIEEIIEKFGDAGQRAKLAGFDAIELHAAHGYLISQFLSPLFNRRRDGYGGNTNGRCKFLVDIMRRLRENVGEAFPLIVRISADEKVKGGYGIEEGIRIAKICEAAGASIIHVSAGIYESRDWIIQPMNFGRGCLVDMAQQVKKRVTVPVIAVGRINDPILADAVVREGKADLIAMGRGLIADPDLPKKAKSGRLKEIRKCIGSNNCIDRVAKQLRMKCTVNPEVGRESELKLQKTPYPRKIVVIGAGPGGLEAARIASLKGHRVTLFEKSSKVGGQLRLAMKPPGKEEIGSLLEFLQDEVRRLGTDVILNSDPSEVELQKLKPDGIIVATGAKPINAGFSVSEKNGVYLSWQVFEKGLENGRAKRIVMIGGGRTGYELAATLAKMEHDVIIIEPVIEVADKAEYALGKMLGENNTINKIELLKGCKLDRIYEGGHEAIYLDKKGNKRHIKADIFVISIGVEQNVESHQVYQCCAANVLFVGDCVKPGGILEAIHSGALAGRAV